MNKLHDYFGNEVNVGDIILGATPRRNHFQDTSYSIAVVIGRTKSMLRLHKLGEQQRDANLPRQEILDRVQSRYGKKGGRVLPSLVISLNRSTGITQKEFDEALSNPTPIQATPLSSNAFTQIFP